MFTEQTKLQQIKPNSDLLFHPCQQQNVDDANKFTEQEVQQIQLMTDELNMQINLGQSHSTSINEVLPEEPTEGADQNLQTDGL